MKGNLVINSYLCFVCSIAVRRKTEKLKNEKPSFEFERGTNCDGDKSKSILDSSMVVNGSSNNNNKNSSAFSTNDLSVEETSFMELQDVMNQVRLRLRLIHVPAGTI